MNKIKIYAAIFGVCIAVLKCGAQEKKNYKVGVIGFYNLENLFDTINQPDVNDDEFTPGGTNRYTAKVYLDKLDKLSDVLSQIGTDVSPDGFSVLGCAEIENKSVLEDLCNHPKLKGRHYQIVHYNSPDERGVDVGLLFNPKYFTPKFSESLFIDLRNDDSTLRYTRDILYCSGEYLGETIHIMVGHWPSRRGGEEASAPGRAKAAGVCRHKVDSILAVNPNAKIVVMGDLNDDPVSPSVVKVLRANGDKTKLQQGEMYNPWLDYYKKGIGTLAYNDAWNLFDQIIVSQAWLNKKQDGFFLNKALIFRREFMVAQDGRFKGYPLRTYDFNRYIGGYSDHFPTYLMLLKKSE